MQANAAAGAAWGGSLVGGSLQRPAAAIDRSQADQALQKRRADEHRLATRDLDDVVETEFSHGQVSDRDADGRLPWQFNAPAPHDEDADSGGTSQGAPAGLNLLA